MRKPPKWTTFPKFPVVSGTALLAAGVTFAWWAKMDVSPLLENAMLRHGQLWRLLTSIFPHVDILHLAFNVYWLWVFGTLVEEVFGHLKTAALILLFAVGSGAMDYAFWNGGVGLSGVGYGLFGLLWVLSKRDERFRDAIDTRTVQLFVGWFFLCILLTYAKIMQVANIAHAAGALLGILAGFTIALPERRPVLAGSCAVFISFGIWAATLGRPSLNLSPQGPYDEELRAYNSLQANHLEEAVRWAREGISYHVAPPAGWINLGIAYQRQNNYVGALAAYRHAAELGDASAQNAVAALYDNGGPGLPKDSRQAVIWYQKAADQGLPSALNNLAWLYATSSDPAIRNPEAALKYATQAVASDNGHNNPAFLDTLAEAQYAGGRYQDAVKTEREAIKIVQPGEKESYQKSLAKYLLENHGDHQLPVDVDPHCPRCP